MKTSQRLSERVQDLEDERDFAMMTVSRLRAAMEKAITANHLQFARDTLISALKEN